MKSYFFVGIGGSGMLPLAEIIVAQGHKVEGSDRSLDQGRLGAKFEALAAKGIGLFAQDGSGITSGEQIVVASAAVEATVPDIVRATELGCPRMTRAELLAELFNASPLSIAIGGTSGKSTVTGMIGWILDQAGRDPTIMNGAVMKNYSSGSRVGEGKVFVSEVDESDGSIALYRPSVAVLNNVAVDHKSMEELRALFGDFLGRAGSAVVNADNVETMGLISNRVRPEPVGPEATGGRGMPFSGALIKRKDKASTGSARTALSFGFSSGAELRATEIVEHPGGVTFTVTHEPSKTVCAARLAVPGRHNVSNALAALAAASRAAIEPAQGVEALASFIGLKRRMETVGSANGVTVIDDFAHNPDKIAATLSALHAFPGRLLVYFQPHGFGPLKQMGRELADSFSANMTPADRLLVSDPAYFGGTVDRSVGADALVAMIGAQAEHIPARADCGTRLLELAQPGDRIVVMGARDDTLSVFAAGLLDALASA
jgi:UDP-N-acetylmuramate--alanine ligase